MKNRILVIIWLAGMAVAALYTGAYLYAGILAVSGIVIVLSAVFCLLSGRKVESHLHLPRAVEKESVFQGKLELRNRSFWPVFYGTGSVKCKNTFTGEEQIIQIPFSLKGNGTMQTAFEGKSLWCGCMKCTCSDWKNTDFLQLFHKKRLAETEADMVIMPQKHILDLSVLTQEGFDMESFRYASNRPGDDPGETYDIREYRQGDSVRQIHWKLSEKLDGLVIREKSYPVDDAVLILAEPFLKEADPERAEAVVEIFAALLQSFMEKRIPCQAGICDGGNGRFYMEKIRTTEDYENMMYLFLRHGGNNKGPRAVQEYLKLSGTQKFSNYIYITGEATDHEDRYLSEKGLVLTMRCGEKAGKTADEMVFTKEQFHKELGFRPVR